MSWSGADMIVIAAIALIGGCLGGLLGLGGSVFIIPALTLSFGPNQHLYQAAALVANVFVAAAASMRHRGRGTIRRDIVPVMALSAGSAALLGVLVSNAIPAKPLMAMFGVFLCYCALAEGISLLRRKPDQEEPEIRNSPRSLSALIGAVGGFASGLLGIGGGAIMVPLLRKSAKLPMRQAVASSAVAMIAACVIGAFAKNASIGSLQSVSGEPLSAKSSLLLAALLAPAAMLGGNIGATLVYRFPVDLTRGVLALLLGFAGTRMVLTGLG
ncbi:MAG: hypothetical protein RLY21_2079 [Planctomycetota bacterium]|jgi:uncharacterized membrane protein YfcA